ncbi:hypothetical protein [Mesorhizobium sp. DCY119]|uniref:hypothetical protein n=1 Tax=Mesorhizobium sp. DCY119 TaxID=2108445 RepID=UPI001FDFF536|nr:hypothetical protein [Mesorhizobium sp. DCY119]
MKRLQVSMPNTMDLRRHAVMHDCFDHEGVCDENRVRFIEARQAAVQGIAHTIGQHSRFSWPARGVSIMAQRMPQFGKARGNIIQPIRWLVRTHADFMPITMALIFSRALAINPS